MPLLVKICGVTTRDDATMAAAVTNGNVTPELHAAWRDPVVRAAHVYELASVTLVLILMLTKPF